MGFINPTLYENAWALNDIVNGSNPNCGTSGFSAVTGWDPGMSFLGIPSSRTLQYSATETQCVASMTRMRLTRVSDSHWAWYAELPEVVGAVHGPTLSDPQLSLWAEALQHHESIAAVY